MLLVYPFKQNKISQGDGLSPPWDLSLANLITIAVDPYYAVIAP
jgi:hypothetical protein